jgi:hypothetical protein
MATVLECTTEGQRSVVRILWEDGLHAKNKEMFPVCELKCLSRQAAHSGVDKFSQGRSKVADDTLSVRPIGIATEAAVQQAGELIRADRKMTIDSVGTALGCSHGLACSIIHDRLKFRKLCAR